MNQILYVCTSSYKSSSQTCRSTGYSYLTLPKEKEYSSNLHIEIQNRISYIIVLFENLTVMPVFSLFINTMHIGFPEEL